MPTIYISIYLFSRRCVSAFVNSLVVSGVCLRASSIHLVYSLYIYADHIYILIYLFARRCVSAFVNFLVASGECFPCLSYSTYMPSTYIFIYLFFRG